MALPTGRIKLPDRLRNYPINPKWAAYKPVFCMFAGAGANNLINGEVPTDPGTWPTADTTTGGRAFSNNGTDNVGFLYDRVPCNVGSQYSVLLVVESSTSPTGGTPLIGNGTSAGTAKPFNFQLVIDPGVTRGLRFGHTVDLAAGEYDTHDYDLSVQMKDQEPSTISFAANGTTFHKQIDGIQGTHTFSYSPASNTSGSFGLLKNDGNKVAFNGKLLLAIVFDEFIPNEVMYELHVKPQDFFLDPYIYQGIATAAAPFNFPIPHKMLNYRKSGRFM